MKCSKNLVHEKLVSRSKSSQICELCSWSGIWLHLLIDGPIRSFVYERLVNFNTYFWTSQQACQLWDKVLTKVTWNRLQKKIYFHKVSLTMRLRHWFANWDYSTTPTDNSFFYRSFGNAKATHRIISGCWIPVIYAFNELNSGSIDMMCRLRTNMSILLIFHLVSS